MLEEHIDEGNDGDVERVAEQFWGARHIDDALARRITVIGSEDPPTRWFYVTDVNYGSRMVLDSAGAIYERVTYDAYGRPEHRFASDVDADGDADIDDFYLIYNNIGKGLSPPADPEYSPDADLDRDGEIDFDDLLLFQSNFTAYYALDPGAVSDPLGPDSPIGLAGYLYHVEHGQYNVRYRWYDPAAGRWLQRDPAGYTDGMSLYLYGMASPWGGVDPLGLQWRWWEGWGTTIQYAFGGGPEGLAGSAKIAGAYYQGLGEGAVGNAKGAVTGVKEFGLTVYDAVATPVDTAATLAGIDTGYEPVSAIGKNYMQGGDWHEVISDQLELGTSLAIAAGTGGAAPVAQATVEAIVTQDYQSVTDTTGAVAGINLLGTAVIRANAPGSTNAAKCTPAVKPGPSPVAASSVTPRTPTAAGTPLTSTVRDLRAAGLKDAHHVVQDAAVRDLPGYNTQLAPGVQLPGPSTAVGTPHFIATQVQRLAGGGNLAAEMRIAYRGLRRAGYSQAQTRQIIAETDAYFRSIGANPATRHEYLVTAESLMHERLTQPVRQVIEYLVAGKYEELEALTGRRRLSAQEMAKSIGDYGQSLVIPPDSAFGLMDVVEVLNAQPQQWSVTMPLWTHEEGRSDLSIAVTLIARERGFRIELDDIHVL